MTSTQVRADAALAGPVIDSAASVAATLAPQYGALILLGAAIAKRAPSLLADALEIHEAKGLPTPEQNAALDAKITRLENL